MLFFAKKSERYFRFFDSNDVEFLDSTPHCLFDFEARFQDTLCSWNQKSHLTKLVEILSVLSIQDDATGKVGH